MMKSALELLRGSPEIGTLPEEHLAYLAEHAVVRTFIAGETVYEQGATAKACFMLRTGEVVMSVGPSDDEGEGTPTIALRHFNGPGTFLGWSSLVDPRHHQVSVTTVAPTTLLEWPRKLFKQRMKARPDFGAALLERVISILGNRLRDTRIRLVTRRYATETMAIRSLLDQSAETLRVDSPLHKIPHYLESRLTLGDAFRTLELVQANGDHHEREVAILALEILQQVRKELALYKDLQHVYESVASASPDSPAAETRRRCCEEFVELYEKLDYIIEGVENLPDTPGHIFIMNHLVNHPDNTLPNRFQLTLDSHFVSSMIILKKYGEAPIRVIRKSKSHEFGHQRYYDRLGYLFVASEQIDGASADPPMTPEERRGSFLETAGDHLRAGRNLVICPEGTSTTTEASPLGFRAGAFRLAQHVDPEPFIVPVAVANFDKTITRTRVVACVHEPFKLSTFVKPSDSDAVLFSFINTYQRHFAQQVRQAEKLAGA